MLPWFVFSGCDGMTALQGCYNGLCSVVADDMMRALQRCYSGLNSVVADGMTALRRCYNGLCSVVADDTTAGAGARRQHTSVTISISSTPRLHHRGRRRQVPLWRAATGLVYVAGLLPAGAIRCGVADSCCWSWPPCCPCWCPTPRCPGIFCRRTRNDNDWWRKTSNASSTV